MTSTRTPLFLEAQRGYLSELLQIILRARSCRFLCLERRAQIVHLQKVPRFFHLVAEVLILKT